ncbi:class 3 adenylate cyclase [Inhella inkyongensis]|uniref:Class 3 adenylate cyclase n=1 Tax=Inhella inkyongensis TaxID=392593 RepID=A0A840SBX4_9BURK|nr:adenylate/guanylate cyclase domain-containing protein [Inhella inkyongensis]MBB5205961.1 class 3 adenylate cyclase [Inhella inkyongensis]
MTQIRQRTVVFADLRGSTALFENLGNAEATSVVTHTIGLMRQAIADLGGRTVKTLGDGLMAVFDLPSDALTAAVAMHEALERLVAQGRQRGASPGLRALRLQVAMSYGEVVEMGGDCFGDAVNVAARLIDHAGDNETLVTAELHADLSPAEQRRFRSLEGIKVRGRLEPVHVYALDMPHGADPAATQFGDTPFSHHVPDGIRLVWLDIEKVFDTDQLPIVLGRSTEAAFCITDARVSRSHARIDWHAGSFTLTDLSFNGSYVRFAGSGELLALRRSACTLHGQGAIGLGSSPAEIDAPVVRFEVLHFADTLPHSP